MALNFNKYAQHGYEFLNRLAEELEHSGETAKASNILRAVLHALRDRLTIQESIDLLAQLPMFLKAVYVIFSPFLLIWISAFLFIIVHFCNDFEQFSLH